MPEYLIPTQWSVSKLMDSFREGQIAVPEIQRDVVWSSDQVKDLVDSIFNDYPCGSLILWEPRLKDQNLVKEIIRPERLDYYKGMVPKYFLIDGQQRVSALASVILQPGFLKEVEPEIENELTSLCVNLRHFPSQMEAATEGDAYKFPWVLMNALFDNAAQQTSDYKTKLSNEERNKIEHSIQRFRDYQFPVQIIQERKYATVGKIFALVNSQGTMLTGAEIHLANIIPYWKGISKEFRAYRRDMHNSGYDIDLTFLMKAITVIECNVPQIRKLADKISQKELSKGHLNDLWRRTKKAIDAVVDVLRKDLLLDKSQFFQSKNALVPLVYYVAKSTTRKLDRKAMMKYFIVSQLGGHYSQGADTVLRRDIKWISEPGIPPKEGLRELLDVAVREAKWEYRGLKIRYRDITGVPSKNVIVLMMYMIMRRKNATDLGLAKPQPLNQIPKLQLHHIFPFDFMMSDDKAKQYQKERELKAHEFRLEVNDIANITFLSQAKNADISNQSPWQYLENESTPEMRKAHFIPENKELWKPEVFDKFLEQRRKLLAPAMNSLLKSLH